MPRGQALARLGALALERADLSQFLDEAVALSADALGLPAVAVFEHLDRRGLLVGRAGYHGGTSVGWDAASLLRVPTGRGSLPGYTLLEGEAVVAPDMLGDSRFLALAPTLGFGARAAISVPIRAGDRDWGVLSVYDDSVRHWSQDEIDFVRSAANVVALAQVRFRQERGLHELEARLALAREVGGLGTWAWRGATNTVEMDDVALRMHGLSTGGFVGTPDAYRDLVVVEDQPLIVAAVAAVIAGADDWDETYRVARATDGSVGWIRSVGRMIHSDDVPLRIVGICLDVTEALVREAQLDASLVAEMAARRQAERAGAREATLSEASTLFSQSLDPDEILTAVADFCVPLLGDVCRVEAVADDGRFATSVVRAASDARLQAFHHLEGVCPGLVVVGSDPRPVGGDLPPGGELTGDRPVGDGAGAAATVIDRIDPGAFELASDDPVVLDALRKLDPQAVVIAPLVARSKVLGRLTLVETDHLRRRRSDHVAMVEEVAARAALALDNGRLYESRARMVDSLQAVLVPRALPDGEGLRFAARYRAGDPSAEVGGDFYDAFEVGDDEWGVMVGDVCGRGPDAAALTGLVRHSIRAAAVRDSSPVQVLSQANDAVIDQIDDFRFCTATFMTVRRTTDGVHARVSSAGHPRPVVVRAGGRAEMLDCSGVVLGVVRSPSLVSVQVDLAPGDAVVLYTDGVTEARGPDGLFGDDRLLQVLSSVAGGTAEAIASALEEAVRAHHREGGDDLAIVVVQASV